MFYAAIAATIFAAFIATISVLKFFVALARKVLVYLLHQGRQMLSQLYRRPQQPLVVDEHPAPPQPRTREHPAPAPLQPVVVDEHPAPLGLGRRQVTLGDNLSRDHLALQPHTRGESAPRSAFLLDNSERNKFFFAKHVGDMRLVLSQISGLTTQVSQTPIDPSRRQFFGNLRRRVPHSYVMHSKAQRALEELTRLWNQLRQQHPHRLSEYQQVFDECVLYEQVMDIIFLEMRLRAEFAASPAPETTEDYGVRAMEVEETPIVDLAVAEDAAVVAVSRKSLSLFVLFLFTFNSHLTLVYMFILITILQHYSQAPLVEEVAAKVAVEEEVDAKLTRKRSAEMNDGERPSKKARVHNDASSQVAVEGEEDVAVVAVSHVVIVILLFTLLFTFSLNHLTLLIPTLQLLTDSRC